WDGGFVSIDVGLLDYEYTDYQYVDFATNPPVIRTGVPPIAVRTPEWSITASVEHAFTLANGATITPQIGIYAQDDYRWMNSFPGDTTGLPSDQVPDGFPLQFCDQDAYTKTRLRVTYEPAEGNWQAAVFGYNITDEEILAGCGATRTGTYRWYH